jgi:hypothetical protein
VHAAINWSISVSFGTNGSLGMPVYFGGVHVPPTIFEKPSFAVVRYIDLAWLTYPNDNVVIVLVQSQKLIFYVQLHI